MFLSCPPRGSSSEGNAKMRKRRVKSSHTIEGTDRFYILFCFADANVLSFLLFFQFLEEFGNDRTAERFNEK